jgi:beta-lactamase class A
VVHWKRSIAIRLLFVIALSGCATSHGMNDYVLDYDTPVSPALQAKIDTIDARLRSDCGMGEESTAVGLLDLRRMELAVIRPDRIDYAASVAKVGILLAYFELHPEAARNLDAVTRHELGLMIKQSSNEMAAKYSRQMGLREIQMILDREGFYDATRGGGIWVGKHYGPNSERIGDPVANHSHGATVRQLLRFYLMLEQGKLVSPEASKTMREIFTSPDIPYDDVKFVRGLAGRNVAIRRKLGTWQTWLHDTAVITGPGRRYLLVALVNDAQGDAYLEELARAVDDVMIAR